MRYFWRQYEVTPQQATELMLLGLTIVTERDDEWFWKMWS